MTRLFVQGVCIGLGLVAMVIDANSPVASVWVAASFVIYAMGLEE